jgi:quercetin dioxygenase-like cupin family protein
MENKYNEATLNRPEGDRVIDAPQVFIDLDDYLRQIREESAWEKNDRNAITVFKTDKLSMVLVGLHANAKMEHQPVDGILTIQLLEGKASVKAGGKTKDLKPATILTLHPSTDHIIEALDDTFLLLTVYMVD